MAYSRANPSPRYLELSGLYRQMHTEGERTLGHPPERTFPGGSLLPQVSRIRQMIAASGAQNILDYGCGKGLQYELRGVTVPGEGTFESVQDYWDVDYVHCYDPNFLPLSEVPTGTFDGVICTDVLEHCPEDDIAWIVDELFAYANRFVFANVACYPARKQLPNGENAHVTLKPVPWWGEAFAAAASRRPGVAWQCLVTEMRADGKLTVTILKG